MLVAASRICKTVGNTQICNKRYNFGQQNAFVVTHHISLGSSSRLKNFGTASIKTIGSSYSMPNLLLLRRRSISDKITEKHLQGCKREQKCWMCHLSLESMRIKDRFFCSRCSTIQPLSPEESNYFSLFGLDRRFDLDVNELEQRFKTLQRRLHPDRFHMKSKTEQEISDDDSKKVNEAYQILKDRSTRALYLLELAGEKLNEDEKISDVNFLSQILAIREEIEDGEMTKKRVAEILSANRKRIEDAFRTIDTAFKENDLKKVKETMVAVQYYDKIAHELHEKFFDIHQRK